MMEDVIAMVNTNQKSRETVPCIIMKEDQARELILQGKENAALQKMITQSKREKLGMQVMICTVCLILVAACIAGVHTEAMSEPLAWAMSLPCTLSALLCCLPKAKDEEDVQ